MYMKKIFDSNKFNIHFKDDYLKLGSRRRLNTNVRDDLLTQLEEISYHSKQPMSKMLDVLLIDLFESEDIVKSFAEKDARFRLINQPNAGCSAARNHGLREAAAPYVALLDQDDMLHPQAMEVLYYLIQKGNLLHHTLAFKLFALKRNLWYTYNTLRFK